MNYYKNINKLIELDGLKLKPISINDGEFISTMFEDKEISKYYIIPKEADQNKSKIVQYWLNDIKNQSGLCWIIYKKNNNIFSTEKKCGFVTFEYRNSLKNARLTYAILPKFRSQGIATESVSLIINQLEKNGVKSFEADIDRDNSISAKIVENLGFLTNNRQALFDPEMMRDGKIRMRNLWTKQSEYITNNKNQQMERVSIEASKEEVFNQVKLLDAKIKSNGETPELGARLLHLIGRVRFLQGEYDLAKEAFGNSNAVVSNNNLPEIHENFYWFAKIHEAKGENENAKMYYSFALENYCENSLYVSKAEIESKLN